MYYYFQFRDTKMQINTFQPAKVQLFSHICKFLVLFVRFFCIFRHFLLPLQRESANYGHRERDAG